MFGSLKHLKILLYFIVWHLLCDITVLINILCRLYPWIYLQISIWSRALSKTRRVSFALSSSIAILQSVQFLLLMITTELDNLFFNKSKTCRVSFALSSSITILQSMRFLLPIITTELDNLFCDKSSGNTITPYRSGREVVLNRKFEDVITAKRYIEIPRISRLMLAYPTSPGSLCTWRADFADGFRGNFSIWYLQNRALIFLTFISFDYRKRKKH